MPYIFSTLSSDTTYQNYAEGGSDLPNAAGSVTVTGRAGIADKRTLDTPRGAATKVTDEQLAILESNSVFQLHKANGFVTIENSDADIDSVVANMTGRDPSSPLVPQDFVQGDIETTRQNNQVSAPETSNGGKGGDKVATKK